MLHIVDLTELHPGIAGDAEITVYVAGDEILTILVNVDGQAVARVGVPASARIGAVIGKVSGEVAMAAPQTAKSLHRLC